MLLVYISGAEIRSLYRYVAEGEGRRTVQQAAWSIRPGVGCSRLVGLLRKGSYLGRLVAVSGN